MYKSNVRFLSLKMLACLLSTNVMALEALPEDELSESVAQDGVSLVVKLPSAGLIMKSIAFGDTTGIPSAIKPGYDFNRADLVLTNFGVQTCQEATIKGSCTPTPSASLKFNFDLTGDANNNGTSDDPMLNIKLNFIGGANKLRFYVDKLAIRNGSGNNQTDFMDLGGRTGGDIDPVGDYVDLLVPSGAAFLNFQMANESQGHMLTIVNGNFGSLDFGTVSILDKQYTPANNRSLRFGFRIDNVDLTGTGFDISEQGLTYNTASFVNPIDITLSNISAGNITTTDMGTIGIKGLQVTNLAMTITGKD